jgi:hypothetical protein
MVELVHVSIARAAAEPKMLPVLSGVEAGTVIPKAAADAKRAPCVQAGNDGIGLCDA